MKKHGIERELVVKMERNFMADSLSYLTNQQMNQPSHASQRLQRRASVASTSLFAIGNSIREAGYDYFGKIPRSNHVQMATSSSTTQPSGFGLNEGASTSSDKRVVDAKKNDSNAIKNCDYEYEDVEYLDSSHSEDGNIDQNSIIVTVDMVVESVPSSNEYEYTCFDGTGDFDIAHLIETTSAGDNDDGPLYEEESEDEYGITDLFEEPVPVNEETVTFNDQTTISKDPGDSSSEQIEAEDFDSLGIASLFDEMTGDFDNDYNDDQLLYEGVSEDEANSSFKAEDDDSFGIANLFDETTDDFGNNYNGNPSLYKRNERAEDVYFDELGISDLFQEVVSTTDEIATIGGQESIATVPVVPANGSSEAKNDDEFNISQSISETDETTDDPITICAENQVDTGKQGAFYYFLNIFIILNIDNNL